MDQTTVRAVAVAVAGNLALATAMGIGRFVYTPILPHMVSEIGLTQSEAGLIASANFVGYLVGAILTSLSGLPGSRRSWLYAGLAASVAATALTAAGEATAYLLAVRFIAGVASAFVLVFASAMVVERLTALGRAPLSAVHWGGPGTGIALSSLLVAILSAEGSGWRGLWLWNAALGLACVAAVIALIGPISPNASRPVTTSPRIPVRRGAIRVVIASYGLFGFGYVITATFLVALVRGAADLRPLEPYIWLLVGVSAMPSVVVWNAVARRYGVGYAYAAACVIQAFGAAAGVSGLGRTGVVLAALTLGGTFVAVTSLGIAAAQSLSGGDPRRTIGVMTVAFGAGQIVGPIFAGRLFDATGSFAIPTLGAAAAMIVAGLALAPIRVGTR